MTDDVNWVQKLIDKHAGNMLNYIRVLPLNEKSKQIMEIELKQMIANISSDVLKEAKDICFKVMDKKIEERKNDLEG